MDANLSLFNQINSLCYWLLIESSYKSSVILDADKDSYFVKVRKGNENLYAYQIPQFSKKSSRFLNFELKAVVNSLLLIKNTAEKRRYVNA